ncbi:type II toxin-antitoxin system HipA family toxin [Nocardia sp. NPDC058519]|uniref:type II toxin-antitoxin system HipA family toxin n=1 Tax=Nocardia sp. NPDC058519 TaxID=3346535 RepID=UPI00365D0EC4
MSSSLGAVDLRTVEVADVYKNGRFAGWLRRERDDVTFTYAAEYRDDPVAPSVAYSLPKSTGMFRTTGGSVPPFFAGLLPEGVRLGAVTRANRTSEDDHFTILLSVGADTIGDVQVVAAGIAPQSPLPIFDEEDSTAVDFAELFTRATAGDLEMIDRTALPGVQMKVSAEMLSTPVITTGGPAILKLDPAEYPLLVDNEEFFLNMAHDAGISVPNHRLGVDRTGRKALFVERFDRVVDTAAIRRLAQEDACQVLGRYPAAKYRMSMQEAIIGLASAVREGGGSYRLASLRMLEIAAFSYLIGNGDLHGKNLSIRRDTDGLWGVTPAYDLLSTQPYLGWNDPMALQLYGRAAKLTRRWWLDAADRLGVPERAITKSLTRIIDSAEPWLCRMDAIGYDDKTTDRLAALVSGRRAELYGRQ